MKEIAVEIVRQLQQAGHTAYFAGGCVRDMLRGVSPNDFDIATSATPEIVQKIFPKTIPVGAQFGVVLVIADSHQFQVATFRSDDAYVDGRRPESVTFSDAKTDAERRDFTINGLFYDPIAEKIIDFVGGQRDIAAKIVKTIGEPERRFAEDKLRMLRAVRFSCALDYEIEPKTRAAIQKLASEITVVSAERIRDELIKMFTGPRAGRALALLDELGLLAPILPEISAMKGVPQPAEFHPEGDVFEHTKLMLDSLPPNPSVTLAFAILLHDVGKPPTFQQAPDRIRFNEHDRVGAEMAETILRRLRFPNDEIEKIVLCVAEHMRFQHVQEMRPAKLKRILGRETFPDELELHRIDCAASHRNLENYEFLKQKAAEIPPEEIRPPRLVTGNDLLALGVPEGPKVGEILREIEELILDGKLKTREEAMEFVRQKITKL
jgi:poly(A) polymerase